MYVIQHYRYAHSVEPRAIQNMRCPDHPMRGRLCSKHERRMCKSLYNVYFSKTYIVTIALDGTYTVS